MAWSTVTITVDDTPTPVTPPGNNSVAGYAFRFHIPAATPICAGGADVTYAAAAELPADTPFESGPVIDHEPLYLICNTGATVAIPVLFQGV